jgi:hypothetical protein
MVLAIERMFDYLAPMSKRLRTDHDLESLRRSLAMLQTNQLALTRDQGMDLVTQLIDLRRKVDELDAQLAGRSAVPNDRQR